MSNEAEGNSLDDGAGGECKYEAERTQLDALIFVPGNQSSQCRVSNVVCGVEASVQHYIEDEEEGILCNLAPGSGNGEDCEQADTAAEVRPQHPGTGFAHLGVCLINEEAEDDIGNAVEDLGNCHQGTDNAGVQTDGIGQVDHNEEGQERIHHITSDVTGAVTDLVIPLQISLFVHRNSP